VLVECGFTAQNPTTICASALTRKPRHSLLVYTICPDNGGKSGSGYFGDEIVHTSLPCNSKGHSTPASVRDFHQVPALC